MKCGGKPVERLLWKFCSNACAIAYGLRCSAEFMWCGKHGCWYNDETCGHCYNDSRK
jgi:hypothetical protein